MKLAALGAVGVLILAFNPHIVSGIVEQAKAPVSQWKKGQKSPLVLDSPKFPGRQHQRPAARTIDGDRPAARLSDKGLDPRQIRDRLRHTKPAAKPFGAKAVGVQRARGL